MKRSFGTMINTSAVGNPLACQAATLAAAAIIIQAFYRGQVDRRYATAVAAFQLAVASGLL